MARKELPAETWDEISRRWRMGASEVQLAGEFEVSRKAIYNKRVAGGWKRDLKAQYQEAVLIKTARDVAPDVAPKVACEVAPSSGVKAVRADPSQMSAGDDATAVEILATVASKVVGEHRLAAHRGRHIASLFFSQLEEAAGSREALEAAILAETAEADTDGEGAQAARIQRAQMLKAVSLPAQVGVLKDLSTAIKNFVSVERQALGLDDDKGKAPAASYVFNLNMRGRGREPRTIDG